MDNLESIGYDQWIESRLDTELLAAHKLARVVSVRRDRYLLTQGYEEVTAELSGNLFYSASSATDLPTAGDWVYADFHDDDSHAIIHAVVPRKSLLKRKTAGKLVDLQLIAANIDVAFIIQSADYNFNLRRLERYLVMINEDGITPVILLSKCDLLPKIQIDEMINTILGIAPQSEIIAFSNLVSVDIEKIKNLLLPGYTYCLIGSSGVGKTSLLNGLIGSEKHETQAVSKKDSKGRHTTTSRDLIMLDNGSLIIDTPGMRELGNISVDTGIDETFSEILDLAQSCKFNNCTHTNEKGCAILAALKENKLSKARYKNYLKMKSESDFNDMSYSEKRKKDREFGKMIRSTIKSKRR